MSRSRSTPEPASNAFDRAPRGDKQGATRRGPRSTTREGDRLVHLSKAIECWVLLAETERRLAPRTVVLYAKALEVLDKYAREHRRGRMEDFTPNLVRAAAAAQMVDDGHRSINWKG